MAQEEVKDLDYYFWYKCQKGLEARGLADKKEYQDRLAYEYKVIKSMTFAGYFLIVADLIAWAKAHKILISPGRGSGAGSLIAYCLGITNLDPIRWGLIFERFLNPERISLPDFDMDFQEDRRSEVIEYVTRKYGADKVAHIGTFGQMKAKGAVRAAARTLGTPELGDTIAKKLLGTIAGKPQSIASSIEKLEDVARLAQGNTPEANVLCWSQQLENTIQSVGVHPSGVVIANEPLVELVPLFLGKGGEVTTQWDMNNIEQIGLVKFDFLGLKTLTKISMCLELIESRQNIKIDIDNLNLDDEETYAQLRAGSTQGVFQMETSSGIRDLLVKVKPRALGDLSLVCAIYRPGPIQSSYFPTFLAVRAGTGRPEYLVPELETILGETDGFLIYQEEAMKIATDLCGYTMPEADELRKAIGKKKMDLMLKHKEKFINGWVANNLDKEQGETLWIQLVEFANYSFNKSHSYCYGLLAYQTAYLKTHYAKEWMLSVLTCDRDSTEQILKYLTECKRLGIKVLPPDINKSGRYFNFDDDDNIRFGLGPIKNLGDSPVDMIIKEREENGPFKSFDDFVLRIDCGVINRLKIESLVKAGAFDSLGENRASILDHINNLWEYKKDLKSYNAKLETFEKRQIEFTRREEDIFLKVLSPKGKPLGHLQEPVAPEIITRPIIKKLPEMEEELLLLAEHELLNFFVTSHPLDKFQETIRRRNLLTIEGIKQLEDRENIIFAAVISAIKPFTTKTKKNMAFLDLEDLTGQIDGVLFAQGYEKYKDILVPGRPMRFVGKVDLTETDEERIYKVLVSDISLLVKEKTVSEVIEITTTTDKVRQVAEVIQRYKGNEHQVRLIVESEDGTKFQSLFSASDNKIALLKEIEQI